MWYHNNKHVDFHEQGNMSTLTINILACLDIVFEIKAKSVSMSSWLCKPLYMPQSNNWNGN